MEHTYASTLIGMKAELNRKHFSTKKKLFSLLAKLYCISDEIKTVFSFVGLKREQLSGCDWAIIRRFWDKNSPKPANTT